MSEATINEPKIVRLVDGSTIEVRPLKISLLRKFMEKFSEIEGVAEDNDKSTTVLVECAQIALKQYRPEIADDVEALEELLDLPAVYEIIEAASGIKLAGGGLGL
jgi:hypothetical protein